MLERLCRRVPVHFATVLRNLPSIIIFVLLCIWTRKNYVKLKLHRRRENHRIFRIIQAVPNDYDFQRVRTFQSLLLLNNASLETNQESKKVEYIIFDPRQQREFIVKYGSLCDMTVKYEYASTSQDMSYTYRMDGILGRYDRLAVSDNTDSSTSPSITHTYVQIQLWKYCALSIGYANAFIDYDDVHLIESLSNLLESSAYDATWRKKNFMVRLWERDSASSILHKLSKQQREQHQEPFFPLKRNQYQPWKNAKLANPSFIVFDGGQYGRDIASKMLLRLMTSPHSFLTQPMSTFAWWHSRELYNLAEEQMQKRILNTYIYEKRKANRRGLFIHGFMSVDDYDDSSSWEWLDSFCFPTSIGSMNFDDSVGSTLVTNAVHLINPSSEGDATRLWEPTTEQSSKIYLTRFGALNNYAKTETRSLSLGADSAGYTSKTNPYTNASSLTLHCTRHGQSPCCEVRKRTSDHKTDPDENPDTLSLDQMASSDIVLLLRHPSSTSNRGSLTTHKINERAIATMEARKFSMTAFGLRLPYLFYEQWRKASTEIKHELPSFEASSKFIYRNSTYTSVIREQNLKLDISSSNGSSFTPNFMEVLLKNDCIPSAIECPKCLRELVPKETFDKFTTLIPTPFGCKSCEKECGCFCTMLCHIRSPIKKVSKEIQVHPPIIRKNPQRLIPKIIHQTWFEQVTQDKYPNMSRMIESWRQSGWEYRFYDDDASAEFLKVNFPKEISDTYNALLPGAFKADFFRYCVLLIDGGIYADVDVLLTSSLDNAIADDVGFMIPFDNPGRSINHGSCLWNGLLAASPGHPVLAQAIEMIVNIVRNRYTSVDIYDLLCPSPVFHVCHSFATLFFTGPCLLGASLNAILGRSLQDQFEAGDVDIFSSNENLVSLGADIGSTDPRLLIPGRIVILDQNKDDMGAHRFTWKERNLLIASTDMPASDDRPPTSEHYSKTRQFFFGVYGVKKLYTDNMMADENIRVVVLP